MYPSVPPQPSTPAPNPPGLLSTSNVPLPAPFPLAPVNRINPRSHLSSHHPPPPTHHPCPSSSSPLQLSSALMFDAVHVVVGAVRELNRSQEIGVKPLSCTSPQIWQHGTSLMNYLRMVNSLQAPPLQENYLSVQTGSPSPSFCLWEFLLLLAFIISSHLICAFD